MQSISIKEFNPGKVVLVTTTTGPKGHSMDVLYKYNHALMAPLCISTKMVHMERQDQVHEPHTASPVPPTDERGIDLIMKYGRMDHETAVALLRESHGDLGNAIMKCDI